MTARTETTMIGALPIPAGTDEIVILRRAEYDALRERIDDLELALGAARDGAGGNAADPSTLLTAEDVEQAAAAPSLVDFWMRRRGAKAVDIADAAEISQSMLSEMRAGKKTGTAKTLQAIARALGLPTDALIA